MTDFYNDNDPTAAGWLESLASSGAIPAGTVSAASVAALTPRDLEAARRVHFFAGIGGWPLALDLAAWPRGLRTWTGSCPCQPFSGAGKGLGFSDPRHLWPVWFGLIRAGLPDVVLGEQTASPAGRQWLAATLADLESIAPSTGWPTPSARDWKDSPGMAPHALNPDGSRRSRLDQLPRVALLAGWPTPTEQDSASARNATSRRSPGARPFGAGLTLTDAGTLAGWPTPMAGSPATEDYNAAGSTDSSRRTIALSAPPEGPGPLRITAAGEERRGAAAALYGSGPLNPEHSRWLMGFPPGWSRHCPVPPRRTRT